MKGIDFNTNVPVKDIDRELVSKKLETLINAVVQIHFYVQELQNDRHLLMLSIDEYRTDKLRAIDRARKAESKLETKEN